MIKTSQTIIGDNFFDPLDPMNHGNASLVEATSILRKELRVIAKTKFGDKFVVQIYENLYADLFEKGRRCTILSDIVTTWIEYPHVVMLTNSVYPIITGPDLIGYGIRAPGSVGGFSYFSIQRRAKFSSDTEYATAFIKDFGTLVLQQRFQEG